MNVDLTQDVEVGQLYLHEFYLRLIWRHFSLSFPPPFLFFFFFVLNFVSLWIKSLPIVPIAFNYRLNHCKMCDSF